MPNTVSTFSGDAAFGDVPANPVEAPSSVALLQRRERSAWVATIAGCCILLAGMACAAPYLPGADTVPHSAGCRVETAHLCR